MRFKSLFVWGLETGLGSESARVLILFRLRVRDRVHLRVWDTVAFRDRALGLGLCLGKEIGRGVRLGIVVALGWKTRLGLERETGFGLESATASR